MLCLFTSALINANTFAPNHRIDCLLPPDVNTVTFAQFLNAMLWTATLFCLALICSPCKCLIPQPASFYLTQVYYLLPFNIDYKHNAPYCFTLHSALKRLLEGFHLQHLVRDLPSSFSGNITVLTVNISTECNELMGPLYPNEYSKEECKSRNVTQNLSRLGQYIEWSNRDNGGGSMGSPTWTDISLSASHGYSYEWGLLTHMHKTWRFF